MNNCQLQSICKNLCDKLCNHLTVIKEYFELSEEKSPINYSKEIKREIDDTVRSIKEGIDELNSWNI